MSRRSEAGGDRAFECLVDVLAHGVAVVGADELPHPGLALVLFAHDEDVHVGAFGAFLRDGVALGVQPGGEGEVGVDGGGVQVVKRAGQLGGVQFYEFEFFRVFSDVKRGGFQAGIGFELDEALFLQQQEHAAAVGGVVGNAKARAFFQLAQRFHFFGIQADGKGDGVGHADELVATVFDLLLQVGFVLVAVGVQVAGGQRGVGLHVLKFLKEPL